MWVWLELGGVGVEWGGPGGGGGGYLEGAAGTQKIVYQKWPDKIFPIVSHLTEVVRLKRHRPYIGENAIPLPPLGLFGPIRNMSRG